MNRSDCHNRLNDAEVQYGVAYRLVTALIQLGGEQPDRLRSFDFNLKELRSFEDGIHDMYFIRMFAIFESIVRHYWRASGRRTKPPTRQLIDAIAARRSVPQNTLNVVQGIRAFRNSMVHEAHEAIRRFDISEASSHLNTYVSLLPLTW